MTHENDLWTVEERNVIFTDPPHIELSVETVITDRGQRVENFYQLQSRKSCAVVATDSDGNYIMLRQYKHGARKVCLTFPGGRVEAGESLLETAKRELIEETGYQSEEWACLGEFPIHANQHVGVVGIFSAANANLVTAPNPGDLERMKVVKITPTAANRALSNGDIALLGDAAAISLHAFSAR